MKHEDPMAQNTFQEWLVQFEKKTSGLKNAFQSTFSACLEPTQVISERR